ncbi:hypothetical protein EJD97_022784 [Solanum chilense]|uniref:Uncharacterized protein n=1 Tax=Solanum chilense TaxID=4083 RepID=A0A6N2ATD0_SOLCI|nr:hypothetical protein EJD97_022784 [Solanum chilense]
MNQPYNVSILGISQPIVTPGLDGTMAPISAPPPKAYTPKKSPVAEAPEEAEAPAEEEAEAPAEEAEAPAPSEDAPSSAPDADTPPADQAPPPSSATKLSVSFGLFVVLATIVVV